jgi:glycine cleavage system H protein
MPVGGEIVAVNTALDESPELVNNTPYTDGWMIEIKPKDAAELNSLLTKDAYLVTLQGS